MTLSPNPGGQNRRLARTVIQQWITAQAIAGVDRVHRSPQVPDRIEWEAGPDDSRDFRAQVAINLRRASEDRAAYTGPTDPGGKMINHDVELTIYHRSDVQSDQDEAQDDYDRVVDGLKDALRGTGRDFGRPDVFLSAGEYPRQGGITDDHDDPVMDYGGVLRLGTISFTVHQYLQSPSQQ